MFCGLLFRIVLRLVQSVTWFFLIKLPTSDMHYCESFARVLRKHAFICNPLSICPPATSFVRDESNNWIKHFSRTDEQRRLSETSDLPFLLSKWTFQLEQMTFKTVLVVFVSHFFSICSFLFVEKTLRAKNKRKKKPAPVLDSVGNFVFVWINVQPLENEAKY